MTQNEVYLYTHCVYDEKKIRKCIEASGVFDNIQKGNNVVIKPNFVQEKDSRSEEWEQVITHPAIITAVIQLLCEKLNGSGSIIIADAPMCATRFDKLLAHYPIGRWKQICKEGHLIFQIIDLRDEEWWIASNNAIIKKAQLPGDPLGKTLCNLRNDSSEFYGKKAGKGFYGADYDSDETNKAHDGENNWYSVSKTVMLADVFINLPKMKCHRKAGITCCLKNLIGINTNKNYLPHHSNGTPDEGGDQYDKAGPSQKIEGKLSHIFMKIVSKFTFLRPALVPVKSIGLLLFGGKNSKIRGGGWYGNDTLWRTIIDLNKVLFYGDPDGQLREKKDPYKQYIAIVDGIIAGEGNGPLEPDRKDCGYILAGVNPVSVDCVAAFLMGFDYKKIPMINNCFYIKKYQITDFDYDDIRCIIDDNKRMTINDIPSKYVTPFRAASGWAGHIEK